MTASTRLAQADTKLAEKYWLYLRRCCSSGASREGRRGYSLGKIGGFCHLYIGQEAVGVGCLSQLRPDDYMVTTYRDHGQALVRGISSRAVMAELFGKAAGCSKGKGGSMHMFDASLGFLGGHGIVGGHIPLAAGIGFAIKYREKDQVAVCFFGEAAINNGASTRR
jgi:pyruvate dehydrogenase E1 component alpha subunit